MNPYAPPGAVPNAYAGAPPGYGASSQSHSNAAVSEMAIQLLQQTRPWVMTISIITFIASAFMVLGGLALVAMAAFAPGVGAAQGALGLVYIPLAALYIYPGMKLWSYGSAIRQLVLSRDGGDLENALLQQKSFWKFAAIMTLGLIVLYMLVIVVAVFVGIASKM